MERAYYETSGPGSYASPYLLSKYSGVRLEDAKDWLMGQDAYTEHRQKRKKFRRRKTIVFGLDHLWQIDLADLAAISKYNDDVRYLLTIVDCFSRFAFVQPVRRKTASDVTDAFSRVISSHLRQPTYVQSDKGREFLNAVFQKYLSENGIAFYTSENDDVKCALVERFNKTLKSKMWRYFTKRKTYRYVDELQNLVTSYNSTYHTTIKMAPAEVTAENEMIVFRQLFDDETTRKKWKFELGDTVRLNESRNPTFHKSYERNWTRELFRVKSRIPTNPHTYAVADLVGEPIKGKFYAEELQKVKKGKDDIYEVEKVLKTRVRNGKTEYLVRWMGYSPKFDSWVDSLIT